MEADPGSSGRARRTVGNHMDRPKPPELLVIVLAAALLVGSVAGLARGRDDDGGEAAGPGAVEIANFAFGPEALTVSVGATVTWTNTADTTHTVTGNDGETLASEDLNADDTYEKTFDAAGSFEYICKFHPDMSGTITVDG